VAARIEKLVQFYKRKQPQAEALISPPPNVEVTFADQSPKVPSLDGSATDGDSPGPKRDPEGLQPKRDAGLLPSTNVGARPGGESKLFE